MTYSPSSQLSPQNLNARKINTAIYSEKPKLKMVENRD